MVINNLVLAFVLIFISILIASPLVFSQEIVSDIYEVDSYNLGISGGEDTDNLTRSILLAEPGTIFVQNEYGGEEYRYPEDILIIEGTSSDGSGSGGGGGGGAGGGGGCITSLDCENGLHCLNGVCLRLFNLTINRINSPIEKNGSFEVVYEIEPLFNPVEEIYVQGLVFDTGENVISLAEENLSLNRNEAVELVKKIPVPLNIESGPHNFSIRAIYLNLSQSDQKNYFLSVRDENIRVRKQRDLDLIIGFTIFSIFILVGLAYLISYYIKNKDEIVFKLASFFSNLGEKIKIKWREFILWIRRKLSL